MTITQILVLYIKKNQKNLAFFFRLSVCSPPWSCLQSWTSSRLPTLPDQEGGGEHRKGGEEGPDPISPQARTDGYACSSPYEERTLQVWDGPLLHASPVPPVGSAPRWQPLGDFFFFEVAMMPCCCLSRLGHLAALPGNTLRCHGCHHHENTVLGVPQLSCHHAGRGSLPKGKFGIPHSMGNATTSSRTTDEQCQCAKAN